MGTAVQTQDYVIVFTASWETFEDTLLFFHSDFRESLLRLSGQPYGDGRAVGIHVSQLTDDLTFHDYFVIQDNSLQPCHSDQAIRPVLVHLLHFGEENEIAAHRRLAQRLSESGIVIVNPYNDAVAHCDSKFRMSEMLRKQGVATPQARLVSRFTEDKTEAVNKIRRRWPAQDVYVQPDRGTEATGCVLLEKQDPQVWQRWECIADHDLIVRQRAGNLLYNGRNFVVRINVTHDGRDFSADSGYCMVGGPVVSAVHGACREDINEVFGQLGLQHDEINQIRATACSALQAVSTGSKPPRLAGVDLVLEKHDSLVPYVIDVNPRPVAVGSRIIGCNAIGLGDHFWSGIHEWRRAAHGGRGPQLGNVIPNGRNTELR